MNTKTLNTPAEQVEILKAVIEKKPVYFYRPDYGINKANDTTRERFVGTLPDFKMYRYECDTTMVRARILVTEAANFPGVAAMTAVSAEYARNQPLLPGADTLEAWYENGVLQLRKLSKMPIFVHSDTTPVPTKIVKSPTPETIYAHRAPGDSYMHVIGNKRRDLLRANGKYFRSAQLDVTGKTFRVSGGDYVIENRRYNLLCVLKDCVLVSRHSLSKKEMTSWTLPVGTKIGGSDEFEHGGILFDVIRN